VAFVESASGDNPFNPQSENDEHPPTDIRRGQAFVSEVLHAVRYGRNWTDSVIFVTHDEHGGFYDHVAPPKASQGGASSPDGIGPGQCKDLTNESLGFGQNCAFSGVSAQALCPQASPHVRYPRDCANFNQLGFRVPLIAVSPFSKPHYVSHNVGDHTSMLALIEKRFFRIGQETTNSRRSFLTRRDQHADTLENLFDFNHSPSLTTPINTVAPPLPADDCTPKKSDKIDMD
jgi:phospholipase C